MKKTKKNKRKGYRFFIKTILCTIYILVICILGLCSYKIYKNGDKVYQWMDVETTDQYAELEITEMSEKFATIGGNDVHFVIAKENDESWHTFLIAVNPEDYEEYKPIIDYSYERTELVPEVKKVYGYAREINDDLKKYAIKYATDFLPFDNEVTVTDENFEKYLSNVYLDTTLEKEHKTNYVVTALVIIMLILFIVLIVTILDKDKLVDEVDNLLELDEVKKVKRSKRKKI